MNKFSPAFMILSFFGTGIGFFQKPAHLPVQQKPYERMEGRIYQGHLDALEKAEASLPTELPILPLYVNNPEALGLKTEAKEFLVKVVPAHEAKGRIVSMAEETKQIKNKRVRYSKSEQSNQHIPSTPESMLQDKAEERKRDLPLKNTSFSSIDPVKYYDRIIQASELTFYLSQRFVRGGVTLRLHQICKWQGSYLLKFSMLNEEKDEFFIYSVAVSSNNQNLSSEFFMPISCLSGTEEFGVVKFPIEGTQKKKIRFALAESSEKSRTWEIKNVDYRF